MASRKVSNRSAARAWPGLISQEFEGIDLGDKRLDRRCIQIAQTVSKHPNRSIPTACGDWASTQATYRFFANEKVSREDLLAPHRERTVSRTKEVTDVVAIQDTTELDLTTHWDMEGIGLLGHGNRTGMLVHNTIAVCGETGAVLGLLGQQVWIREGLVDKKETQVARRKRERESQCWQKGVDEVLRAGLKGAIHVADREADIYEFLNALIGQNQRFVIRACRNRSLADTESFLIDHAGELPRIAETTIEVPGRGSRKPRQAVLTLRAGMVRIRPPKALSRQGPELEIAVVMAREEGAPDGVERIQWILLTGEPINTAEACLRVLRLYKRRWKVEEFHMGLKTGCGIEERQLETRERLEAFLGLASVISVMLLRLRDAARGLVTDELCLNEAQQTILRDRYRDLPKNPTARDWHRAVARLGGFLARKGDGEPGWRSLWDGMWQLMMIEQGYNLALERFMNPR